MEKKRQRNWGTSKAVVKLYGLRKFLPATALLYFINIFYRALCKNIVYRIESSYSYGQFGIYVPYKVGGELPRRMGDTCPLQNGGYGKV